MDATASLQVQLILRFHIRRNLNFFSRKITEVAGVLTMWLPLGNIQELWLAKSMSS